ncbi:MAG TPA: hypothetical protein VMF08_12565 [Candidatus Sulfotelmatobacter sp.]|nr:hypothetical protein [Candidatus Sulfotelmatobacter sp.]
MNETIFIDCFFYGGFMAAFIFLLFATFVRRLNRLRRLWLIFAFLALTYQGGCYMVLGGIGTATGGNDVDANKMMDPVGVAFVIAIVWWVILSVFVPIKKDENKSQSPDQNKSLPDSASDKNRKDVP